MLLSACAGVEKDIKKPAVAAAKPAAVAPEPDQPVLPKLKPKTPKRKPASPKLTEEATAAPSASSGLAPADGHQQLIIQQGNVPEGREKDGAEPIPESSAAMPVPAVVPAEPEQLAALSSPDELKSKAEAEVAALLGRPTAIRREGTGTIWTYRAGTCSLDVYFFLDVADNQRRALSYEMLPEGADEDAMLSCYKALKETHNVP